MIFGDFKCSSYIAVQTISPEETDGNGYDLCRFINGEIYHATALIGQIRNEMTEFHVELKEWQKILFQAGGDLYKTGNFTVDGEKIRFLTDWLTHLQATIEQPKGFVLPFGHHLNPVFHQLSAIATQAERWYVQTSRLMPLSHGVRLVLYLTSQIAFLLSVYVNDTYGFEHEFVYE